MKSNVVGDVLNDLEMHCPDFADQERARSFMVKAAALMTNQLPPIAGDVLRIAENIRAVRSPSSTLEQARVACWEYLGTRDREYDDPEVCAVRAVICALCFDDNFDPFETLQAFAEFAVGAGASELCQLCLTSLGARYGQLTNAICA